ncbi:MAG: DNA polymerase III subunit gamma/tau [Clostridiales bacterium]|nr:DNA polymerase III subunit gamma/tau [Clostridiales bacterium]
MYQALYRKWRPRTFDDLISQPHITETLKNQVINGRLSHAYLFVGTRGTGKTSCAKILARAVNCENPQDGNPCNVCKSCVGIEDGSVLDVVELDAASNNGVDNVRALRDEAVFSPVSVKKRVYIIDEVHMLSGSAFNALLKILEEPPEHLMFILATTELHKVPATILSRCQRHSFKRIAPEDMEKRLEYVAERENLRLDKAAAALLARLADGSMRDALSLLDQCSGNEHISSEGVLSAMGLAGNLRITELLWAIVKGDTEKTLFLFDGMWRDGKAPANLLSEICSLLRDILMIKVAPKGSRELLSGGYDKDVLLSFANSMESGRLIADIDFIQARIGELRDGRNPKIAAELCLIGLSEPDLGEGIDRLRARIVRLESSLANGQIPKNMPSLDNFKERLSDKEIQSPLTIDDEPPFDIPQKIIKDEIKKQQEPEKILERKPEASFENGASDSNSAEPLTPKEPSLESFSEREVKAREQGGENPWENIKARLKETMQPPQYVHLSQAKGEVKNNEFHIYAASTFYKAGLEKPETQELIRAAIQAVLGETLPIKISVIKETPTGDTSKLDELSKFGNVKFE